MKIVVKKALSSPTIVSAIVIGGTMYYTIKQLWSGNNRDSDTEVQQEVLQAPTRLTVVTNTLEGELKPEERQTEPAVPIKQNETAISIRPAKGPAQQFPNMGISGSSSNDSLVLVSMPGSSEETLDSIGRVLSLE